MPTSRQPTKRIYTKITVLVLVILFILAGFLDYPPVWSKIADSINNVVAVNMPHFFNIPFRLGLDLVGGTHLVYIADMAKIEEDSRDDALQGVRDVIERRVNAFGVAEPVVQTSKVGDSYRVVVELAGISDINEAIKMLGETPILEFKEANTEPPRELTAEESKALNDYNADAQKRANEILKKVLENPNDLASLARQYSEHQASKAKDGNLDFIGPVGEYQQLYEAILRFDAGTLIDTIINTDQYLYIARVDEKRTGESQVQASHLLICYSGAPYCESSLTKEEAFAKIQELKAKATVGNFDILTRENSTEPGASESAGDLGWFSRGEMVEDFENVVFNMPVNTISDVVETDFGYHLIYKKSERAVDEIRPTVIAIEKKSATDFVPAADEWKNTGLSGKHLVRSQVQFDQNTNEPMVALEFNDEGKDLFKDITERNVGKEVAIFLDGEPISIPVVNEAIRDGRAVIQGGFSVDEAKLLAQRLNAGALPVPIELVSEQTVGPALGSESLQKSLFAGLIGFLLVALFMIIYYRLPGFISVLSLAFYAVILLALFKLVPVTLSLSGLAGFILSLGMAVDANVLIFERLKEEIKSGRTLGSCVDEAFKRAWTSIRDGNLTTLIACALLFWFSSSVIKGFALTLGIGVIVSMFSAITVTRLILKLVIAWGPVRNNWRLLGAKPDKE
ncbi:MAG: protein translocase subunit SecD [Patescibacteria group bacterium]|nr:protein translocase subunit SecD [Patescibacteria group bacterium]